LICQNDSSNFKQEKVIMKALLQAIILVVFFTVPLAAQELTGTLKQIQKAGKIKIGYRKSQPPMSFLGKDGIPAGYTIDLCKRIVTGINNKIGKDIEIEYVPVTAEERFDALSGNRIDILCGSTTKTLSRREIVDFTELTFVTGGSFMALKGKRIQNNFDGKKIGVVQGTTTAVALKELFQETGTSAEIVLLNTTDEGINGIVTEKLDAFAADQVVLIGLAIAASDPSSFTILPDLFSFEPFALAVRKNDADFRLVADRVIADLYRSEQIRTIYKTWFGKFSNKVPTAFEAMVSLNATPEK
jgi:glutamate/aspartate transport system substrate-binding protein